MGQSILITGGAGFVGSNLAILFKQGHRNVRIIALDNLKRRGSELNLPRLRQYGIEFLHGDIRNREDLESVGKVDCILECSAEPSVLAGVQDSSDYVINTNLVGTTNCLQYARRIQADVIFLSTSRVYPVHALNALPFSEKPTRFEWMLDVGWNGISDRGISETFPLEGARSLYGTTKLCSELLLREFAEMYGVRVVINRCGVLTGAWQMGRVDQGFVVLWVARHWYGRPLSYIGFGGKGKQVRDILHVADLFDLIDRQIRDLGSHSGRVYNVGGGPENSVSLQELTTLCREITRRSVPITSVADTRPADVRIYLSDCSKVAQAAGWRPKRQVWETVEEIADWIRENEASLAPILA